MVATAGSGSSPTARRYELARRLRELRAEKGRSVDDVAQELECSPSKVSRIESGERVATALDVKVLGRFYGLSERAQADLRSLAAEARKRGWWHDLRSLDALTQTYIGLESAAARVYSVEALLVPGLLQTEAYANALVDRLRGQDFWADAATESGLDPDQVVASRLKRQERVLDGSLQLTAVVDEAALRRRLGQPSLMRDQVERLIELAALPNVTLQMTTFDQGSHPGLDGSFQLLTFEQEGLADVIFLEGLGWNSMARADESPAIVARFTDAIDRLTTSLALSPEDTLTWLHRFHEHHLQHPSN